MLSVMVRLFVDLLDFLLLLLLARPCIERYFATLIRLASGGVSSSFNSLAIGKKPVESASGAQNGKIAQIGRASFFEKLNRLQM